MIEMNEFYKVLPHTADIKLEVKGKSLEEVFEKAAYALMDTTIDISKVEPKETKRLKIEGDDLYELLYNFLEELIIQLDADSMVYSRFEVKINKENGKYVLNALLKGEKLDLKKHNPKIHIKAATYHEMEIKREDGWYKIAFVVDI